MGSITHHIVSSPSAFLLITWWPLVNIMLIIKYTACFCFAFFQNYYVFLVSPYQCVFHTETKQSLDELNQCIHFYCRHDWSRQLICLILETVTIVIVWLSWLCFVLLGSVCWLYSLLELYSGTALVVVNSFCYMLITGYYWQYTVINADCKNMNVIVYCMNVLRNLWVQHISLAGANVSTVVLCKIVAMHPLVCDASCNLLVLSHLCLPVPLCLPQYGDLFCWPVVLHLLCLHFTLYWVKARHLCTSVMQELCKKMKHSNDCKFDVKASNQPVNGKFILLTTLWPFFFFFFF